MTGLFSTLLVAGLLNLSPLQTEDVPAAYIDKISGRFEAGGMVALQLKNGVEVTVDGLPVKVHDNLAIFGYGRDASGPSEIVLMKGGSTQTLVKQITTGAYDVQYVEGVEPKYVAPPESVQLRIAAEGRQKRAARQSAFADPQFESGFLLPSAGRVSGVYGSQRFFNGKPKRPHYGLDIAAPPGTPVLATLSGRVTLAESNMYYEGGLIFIDHGLDLISAYLHLSDLKVKAGDYVERGDVIATIGAKQGRSTGPHLDWRLYWQKRRLDPMKILDETQKAKLK